MKDNDMMKRIELLEEELNTLRKRDRGVGGIFAQIFSRASLLIGICTTIVITTILLYAAQITFSDGTVISADDMNSNFSELYNKFDDYALADHDHNGDYALSNHAHDSDYAQIHHGHGLGYAYQSSDLISPGGGTSWVPVPGASTTITIGASKNVKIYFTGSVAFQSSYTTMFFRVYIDGVPINTYGEVLCYGPYTGTYRMPFFGQTIRNLSAGTYTIALYAKGTGLLYTTEHCRTELYIEEF